jgi:hypothetical protein
MLTSILIKSTTRWNDRKQKRAFIRSDQPVLVFANGENREAVSPALITPGKTNSLTFYQKAEPVLAEIQIPSQVGRMQDLETNQGEEGLEVTNNGVYPVVVWLEFWDICAGQPGPEDWYVHKPIVLEPNQKHLFQNQMADWLPVLSVANAEKISRNPL